MYKWLSVLLEVYKLLIAPPIALPPKSNFVVLEIILIYIQNNEFRSIYSFIFLYFYPPYYLCIYPILTNDRKTARGSLFVKMHIKIWNMDVQMDIRTDSFNLFLYDKTQSYEEICFATSMSGYSAHS